MAEKMLIIAKIYTHTKKLKGELHKPSSLLPLDLSSLLLLESSLAFPPVNLFFIFYLFQRKEKGQKKMLI